MSQQRHVAGCGAMTGLYQREIITKVVLNNITSDSAPFENLVWNSHTGICDYQEMSCIMSEVKGV